MDETPLSMKKRNNKNKKTNNTNQRKCIIHYSSVNSKSEIGQLTPITWQKMKPTDDQRNTSKDCVSEFDEICDSFPHEPNFISHGFHRQCYMIFTNIKKNYCKSMIFKM